MALPLYLEPKLERKTYLLHRQLNTTHIVLVKEKKTKQNYDNLKFNKTNILIVGLGYDSSSQPL
jgi:hypothetical protein